MEPNNLTQEAEAEAVAATGNEADTPVVTNDGGGDNVSIDEGHPVEQDFSTSLPRMELTRPVLSSSCSESETHEALANPIASTSRGNRDERTASPPPKCAICLERCKNKCFTDTCMHQFCFNCLCEWSKVKADCPLCKHPLRSIIYNITSIDQYEEYRVEPPIPQSLHNEFDDFPDLIRNDGRIHHGDSILARVARAGSLGRFANSNDYDGQFLDLYRQQHQITSNDILSQLWRRYVYDSELYAMPLSDVNGRFRDSSAQFYRENPAQIHRLIPWVNRDIVCLMTQTHTGVTTVLESIYTTLTMMDILSPGFRRRMIPYLGNYTLHFIHELSNFARSSHNMFNYDRVVQYFRRSNQELVIEFSSSDDSTDNEIDVADNQSNERVFRSHRNSLTDINLTIHNRLLSISGGGSTSMPRQATQDYANLVIDLTGDTDEQSAVSVASLNTSEDAPNQSVPQVAENMELTSDSSDECEFVLEQKLVDESKPLCKVTVSTSEGDSEDSVATQIRPTPQSKITALVDAKKRSQQLEKKMKNDSQVSSELYNTVSTSEGDSEDSVATQIRPTPQSKITTLVDVKKRNQQLEKKMKNDSQVSSELYNTVSISEGDSEDSVATEKRSSPRSKITALVEAKTRNQQSGNAMQNDSQVSSELYNVGASTSAALRHLIQRGGGVSTEQPQRRGKRLASERIHPTCSRGAADSSFGSNSSSCNEEFVATSTLQKQNSNSRKREKTKKPKQKKHNTDESSGDEDDNGHMGKNLAFGMAIGEYLKRLKAKRRNYRPAVNMPSPMAQEDIEEDGEEHQLEHMDDECSTPLNMQTQAPLNLLHESQAFDGTSMSATTNPTDTIVDDAAEQISSAAVDFSDPQPIFNTASLADADENTTTTTSSGNSNTNGFVNFDKS